MCEKVTWMDIFSAVLSDCRISPALSYRQVVRLMFGVDGEGVCKGPCLESAVMWSTWLIPVLLLSGAARPGHTNHTHSGLLCVNNYKTQISCTWQHKTQHSGQDCSLRATRDTFRGSEEKQCELKTLSYHSDAPRGCAVVFSSPNFNFAASIALKVICNGTEAARLEKYKPGRHIKLDPPSRPSVYRGNISWNRDPFSVIHFDYQLQFKPLSHSWKDIKPVDVVRTFVELKNDSVVLGEQYEARVRIKPVDSKNAGQHHGQWSDWSPSANWTSDIGMKKNTRETNNALTPGLLWIFIALTFILLILITVCIAHRCCMLRAGTEHIPDPSKYFQPLLSVHEGNFQKWLGPQHSTHSFLTPQPCDCDISPVEVSGVVGSSSTDKMLYLHTNLTSSSQQTSSDSQSSSGFSNMGYFYSETQPGTLNLETCSVYFTYHPEVGSNGELQSTSSYERLQSLGQETGQPSSPDSGFGMEGEEEEEEEEEEENIKEEEINEEGRNEETSVVNIQHLVSFVLSLPDRSRAIPSTTAAQVPLSFAQLPDPLPWPQAEVEEAGVGIGDSSESPEAAVVRPSSMVVQPCSTGYLTLKEMQKYSNKSI
ncbi:interleukin-2 receptor subunit beta-like [Astyanax mexicanus]|uniref:Interleukin-2 receptor subunit beta-like n=1 Tax=Astyanax mexicanus TaxID=7994 RepID=A0A8T2MEC2_ASTMX|nr:interleukin-2 receptor subunit beta-like [Astyanax mexicanus]